MPKINPFKPNHPVSPGMFAGRLEEIRHLEKGLWQTKNGHPNNFLVTGERGIGKSSLLQLIKYFANGDIESSYGVNFNFVTVNLVISHKTNLNSAVKLIDRILKRELGKVEKIRSFLESTWDFVQRLKILDSGIESTVQNSEIDILIDDFAYSLSETCKRISNKEDGTRLKDGIIFFIDEADNTCENLHLGYLIKAVTELLVQYECHNVMFIVAGLPDVIDKLSNSHPSSIRIFNHLIIKELSPSDRHYVVERGIEKGNEINEEITKITSKAKNLISTLSEGYPHFIQQFSYSAFDYNSDGEIDEDDVTGGAFGKGGALDEIGTRYYHSAYNEQIKSDDYREVLSIMSNSMNSWIKKSDILKEFSGADYIVTDALKALTSRKIILKNPSKRGEYRLQQRGFALWIKMFGERKK
ncbi:MAG: ATP-binding protein [Tenacibaculum sp.]|nr:ATP-binding protein [Tenacibaculum sp.]